MHKFKLIVDERERAIHIYGEECWTQNNIIWEKKTITTGDYAILFQNSSDKKELNSDQSSLEKTSMIYIIERKSLIDFAASF